MMMTPSVLSAWEVDPLGVAELVAHEVQVGLSCPKTLRNPPKTHEKP